MPSQRSDGEGGVATLGDHMLKEGGVPEFIVAVVEQLRTDWWTQNAKPTKDFEELLRCVDSTGHRDARRRASKVIEGGRGHPAIDIHFRNRVHDRRHVALQFFQLFACG